MRDSWIRWMGWVGEERNSQVLLMTRKQFLLQTGWIFWFSYQKSELGGREALKQFLSPSFSIHTKEVLGSTNTGQPVAHHTALLCSALLGACSAYTSLVGSGAASGRYRACATRSMNNGESPPGTSKTSTDWVPVILPTCL